MALLRFSSDVIKFFSSLRVLFSYNICENACKVSLKAASGA